MSTWGAWVQQVDVDGHTCHVRALSVYATEHLIALRNELLEQQVEMHKVGIRMSAYAAYFGLCDEQGAPLLDPDTPEMAMQIPFPVAQACGQLILELSGLDASEESPAEKPPAVRSVG